MSGWTALTRVILTAGVLIAVPLLAVLVADALRGSNKNSKNKK